MVDITGFAPARFAAVKDAFAGSFAAGEELGARFTLVEDGEVVLDLMGGWADRGQDLVLPYVMSWAAGFMRNEINFPWGPGTRSFGHSGWGGSCAWADPAARLSAAYVMTRQSPHLIGDPRALRLFEALYAAL